MQPQLSILVLATVALDRLLAACKHTVHTQGQLWTQIVKKPLLARMQIIYCLVQRHHGVEGSSLISEPRDDSTWVVTVVLLTVTYNIWIVSDSQCLAHSSDYEAVRFSVLLLCAKEGAVDHLPLG
eukprot:GHUV01019830.1.p1 GENE.GHUV01019830.1~~GHUV01019830.1.p1  ORF type:complete len:125 (+),score=4.97 GHUV01019830.1:1091-1465(+)